MIELVVETEGWGTKYHWHLRLKASLGGHGGGPILTYLGERQGKDCGQERSTQVIHRKARRGLAGRQRTTERAHKCARGGARERGINPRQHSMCRRKAFSVRLFTHRMQTRYCSGLSTASGLEGFTRMKFHISALMEFAFLEAGET